MIRVAGVMLAVLALTATSTGADAAARCVPTRADALGPFYVRGAPVRTKVGSGYVLRGRTLSTACRPIPRVRIEFWLANPQGQYDSAHRATVFSARDGRYRFESNRPPAYGSRPPHIHLRVSARGYRTLVTQHYPKGSRTGAVFNLVLRRSAG